MTNKSLINCLVLLWAISTSALAQNPNCTTLSVNAGIDISTCSSTPTILAATASGGTPPYSYAWSSGSPSVSPTQTTTYTVTVTDANQCTSTDTKQITVIPKPNVPHSTDFSGCEAVTAYARTSNAELGHSFEWYDLIDANGQPIGTKRDTLSTLPPSYLDPTRTYLQPVSTSQTVYVFEKANGCYSDPKKVMITVNPLPTTSPTVSTNSFSGCGNLTIAAQTHGTDTIKWRTAANYQAGTEVASGLTYTASSTGGVMLQQTLFLFEVNSFGCAGANTPINLLVYPVPTAPSVSNLGYCVGAVAAPLMAGSTGADLRWYATTTGGTPSMTAPTPSTATVGVTSYWVSQVVNSCESPRSEIKVTIGTMPSLALMAVPNSICMGQTTQLTAKLSGSGSSFVTTWDNNLGEGISKTTNPLSNTTVFMATVAYTGSCAGSGSLTASVTVNVNAPPIVTLGPDVTINNGSFTTLTANVTGGVLPYTYAWSSGLGTQVSATTNLAGSYIVTVTDSRGCYAMDTVNVVTNNQPSISFSGYPQADSIVVCEQTEPFTAIALTVSGGISPLSMQWFFNNDTVEDAINNQLIINDLSIKNIGTYTLHVTDANGYTATSMGIKLVVNPNPMFSVKYVPIACAEQKTSLMIDSLNGRISQFSYSIDSGLTQKSGPVFSNLIAATYPIRVTDTATGCFLQKNTTIVEPTKLMATVATQETHYKDSNDGQLTIYASGGSPPYLFSLGGRVFQSDSVFANLSAGSYQLSIKDSNKCTITKTANILLSKGAINIVITSVKNVQCYGTATGKILVSVQDSMGRMLYSKNGGFSWQASPMFSNLAAGTYQIKAKNMNGNYSNTIIVTITQPTQLSFTTTKTNLSCRSADDGAITIKALGGTGADSFSINFGAKYFANNTFTNLASGIYRVRVKDENGCMPPVQVINLAQPTMLDFASTKENISCNSNSDGKIIFKNIRGPQSITTYQYSKNNGVTWQKDSIFAGLASGIFNLKVRDANGCMSPTKSVTLNEPTPLEFSIVKQDITCGYSSNGVIGVSMFGGGSPNYKFSKDGGITFQNSNTFISLPVSTYHIRIKDSKNCLSSIKEVNIANSCNVSSFQFTNTQNQLIPTIVLNVFPNPTDDGLIYLELNSLQKHEQEFLFFDMFGKSMMREKRALESGLQRVGFDCSSLPAGIYQVVLTGSHSKNLPARFVKL